MLCPCWQKSQLLEPLNPMFDFPPIDRADTFTLALNS